MTTKSTSSGEDLKAFSGSLSDHGQDNDAIACSDGESSDGESSDGESFGLNDLTRQETADYVADLAEQLAQLARSAGLNEAADHLADAAQTAARVNAC